MPLERSLGILAGLLIWIAIKIASVAMAVWLEYAMPAFMARALHAYRSQSKRSFALGVGNGIMLFILFAVFVNAKIEPLGVLGIIILAATFCAVMLGYTLEYRNFGDRLRGQRDWSAVRTILIGGLITEAAFVTPLIGQVFSLGVLFRGLGAVIGALLSGRGAGVTSSGDNPHHDSFL